MKVIPWFPQWIYSEMLKNYTSKTTEIIKTQKNQLLEIYDFLINF